jgi:WD40 repeat protein
VEDIAFSKDGSLLATASADNTVRLWQVASRTTARVLAQGTPSNAVAFAPDGLTLASGAWDEIRLWSIWDGKQVGTLGGPEKCCAVTTLAYSPDGELLVSGGADGYVNIWRMTDNSLIRAIRPWTNTDARVTSVAVSPDGRLLAVGTNCNLVSVWSMADGGLLYVFTEATSGANGVEFSPDGELLAAAAGDRRVWLWTMK